jgi:two-component system sensor histidine kinase SenX3
VLVLLLQARSRRRLRHRLDVVVARLSEGPADLEGRGLDRAVIRVERTAESVAFRLDAAEADVDRAFRALDALPQGVVLWDESGEEVFRNEAAQVDDLVEETIQELLQHALVGGQQHRTLDLVGPPHRILTVTAIPLDDGNRPNGAFVVLEDISERRRLQAVRRDFVANVSHELLAPIGGLRVLAETIADEDDREVSRRLAARMQGEADRVGRIIDDLISLSQVEAEEHPTREPVELALVVGEAANRVRGLAKSSGVAIDLGGVGRQTVRGDRRQLGSAIANLLDNACRFSEPGSTVHVSCATDEHWVDVIVRDEGIGIDGAELDRIFERFYRAEPADRSSRHGAGLGLALVRHVASSHRGEVLVHSAEGQGSTFTLRLPAAGPLSA